MDDRIKIGEVITVINNTPFKFKVSALEKRADSSDLLNRFPLIYYFVQTNSPSEKSRKNFLVKVKDEIINSYFNNDHNISTNKILNDFVIQFALYSIRKSTDKTEFSLDNDNYYSFIDEPKLEGEDLKYKILEFIFNINRFLPQYSICIFDLVDNFNNSKEKLNEWLIHLYKAELITNGFKKCERENVTITAFTINPKKSSEIKNELQDYNNANRVINYNENNRILIFLSYSTKDKNLAGEIKNELTKYNTDVFLAHDNIEPSEEWVEKIIQNINNCDVFIPILTRKFRYSRWTDQEVGQAFVKGKLIIPLKYPINPYGFINKIQADTIDINDIKSTCSRIINVIENKLNISFPEYSP